MAVVSITPQAHQRTGSSGDAQWNLGTSVRIFQVVTDDGEDDDGVVLFAPGIPRKFDPHPTRPYLYCQSKAVRWVSGKNGIVAEVTCTYDGTYNVPPWQQPAIYSGSPQLTDQIVEKDILTDEPIVNSAGQPFEPGVTAPRVDANFSVTRNELSNGNFFSYNGCVNSDSFYGFGPNYVLCTISFQENIYQDEVTLIKTPYYAMSYQFQCKNPAYPDFNGKILDAGYMKKGESGQLVPITIAGREPSQPAPLDGSGGVLGVDDDPVFKTFQLYPQASFSGLGL